MKPYVVKYDFYLDGVDYLNQTIVVMAKDTDHAETITKKYFEAFPIRRYITKSYELKDNMFIIMDGHRGNSVRIFNPEFCEENGIDFEMLTKEETNN